MGGVEESCFYFVPPKNRLNSADKLVFSSAKLEQ